MAVVFQAASFLSKRPFVRFKELESERYLKRVNCEFDDKLRMGTNEVSSEATHWIEREDWILKLRVGESDLTLTCNLNIITLALLLLEFSSLNSVEVM